MMCIEVIFIVVILMVFGVLVVIFFFMGMSYGIFG